MAEGGESWCEWDQGAHQAKRWSCADEDAGMVQAPLDRKLVVGERVLDAGLFTRDDRSRYLEECVSCKRAGRTGREYGDLAGVGDNLAGQIPQRAASGACASPQLDREASSLQSADEQHEQREDQDRDAQRPQCHAPGRFAEQRRDPRQQDFRRGRVGESRTV